MKLVLDEPLTALDQGLSVVFLGRDDGVAVHTCYPMGASTEVVLLHWEVELVRDFLVAWLETQVQDDLAGTG